MRTIALLVLALSASCAPADTIPSGPNHPANAAAPVGAAPPRSAEPAAIAAAEKEAYQRARPVFEKYCAKCHSSSGAMSDKEKLDHFSIDSYPFGGHHAAEIGAEVRKALGAEGGKPTMPKDHPGTVQGDELDAVVAWSKAFDAAHAAGLHQHGDGGGHEHHGDH